VESLSDLPSYGEPGAVVYRADCVRLMRLMPAGCVDAVFADPPYRLSGGGVTVKGGRVRSVDKGEWDRSLGFEEDHAFNLRWLAEARRVLRPDGTLWVTGTHHIIFSLGYALQSLGFRVLNHVVWEKPDPPPNARQTSFKHAHESLIWASRSRASRHTFNHDLVNLVNGSDPSDQLSSVWRMRAVPRSEKRHGGHPTQKPLRLVRRALLASTAEGELVLDPFAGSGTTAVAAKELGRAFVGAEREEEFAELAARRISAAGRGSTLQRLETLRGLSRGG
jgi:site-specific DNA-methyltransferase (adenine-specific)